ncbi:MBL fold metallo-hydrolase [candidate division KSB1 bacterium]|nr:MBL fold metallo-hydrolase [candidate division KSB1 bacterium]
MKPRHDIDVIILGTGTCVPSPKRQPAGIFVRIGDTSLLLDSGSGTLSRMTKIGIDYRKLSGLCYSHTHPDHVADLVPILQAMKVSPAPEDQPPLLLAGPPGFRVFLQHLSDAYGTWITEHDRGLDIRELNADRVTLSDCIIRTVPMNHSRASIGFRVESLNGTTVVYSGDTDYCDSLTELAANASMLIIECSTPDERKQDGHLTPSLAADIAVKAKVNELVLTHFYAECDDIDIISPCQAIFPGKIRRAYDLMRLSVSPEGTSDL